MDERDHFSKSRVILQRFSCACHKSNLAKKEVFFSQSNPPFWWGWSYTTERRRYDSKLQAIWLIRLQNNSGDSDGRFAYTILSGCDYLRCISGEEWRTRTRLRSETGNVEREKRRPLHLRRAGRLRFFGEIRWNWGESFFSWTRLMMHVLLLYVRYSHHIFSVFSPIFHFVLSHVMHTALYLVLCFYISYFDRIMNFFLLLKKYVAMSLFLFLRDNLLLSFISIVCFLYKYTKVKKNHEAFFIGSLFIR